MIENVNKETFFEKTEKGISIVDFWAPWCGPCRMLAPVLDKIAKTYEGEVNILKVNTDENQDLVAEFGIRSIPTILYMKNGKVIDKTMGAAGESFFEEKIKELLNK
jgi:thioredoxin 1